MWPIDNIFELYQSASNISVSNETSTQRSFSTYDILIWIFLALICLILFLCIIRRRGKKHDQKKFPPVKNIQSTRNDDESIISTASSQTDSVQ